MKTNIFIFEGHDRSGKTTISNAVAKELNTEVFLTNSNKCFMQNKSDNVNALAFDLMVAKYIEYIIKVQGFNKDIVIYRSVLSELVYSKLFKRKTDHYMLRKIDNIFTRLGATIILCSNSRNVYDDIEISDELVQESVELFDHSKTFTECDVMDLNTSSHDIDGYVNKIISYVKTNSGSV